MKKKKKNADTIAATEAIAPEAEATMPEAATPAEAPTEPAAPAPSPITADEQAYMEREFQGLLADYAGTRNGDKADLIRRVYEFARTAHGDDRRLSGDPYIYHPLAVARIVAGEIGLGSTSISAALLHDVVKNTTTTFDDVEAAFGPRIAGLVRGLTQISGGQVRFVTEETSDEHHPALRNPQQQAEKFRNLLLTMSEDVRVILVKIADRLHNMRTLDALAPFKQRRIASETLYLYAPLAYRLGLYNIKNELEDLSLRYDHPDEYAELRQKLQETEPEVRRLFKTFTAPVLSLLDDLGLKYTFTARVKSLYSIWRKMRQKGIPFEEVYDLYATRIVFTPQSPETEKTDCWRIYTALTTVYKVHPDRIRDWISRPKQNGYEALHVTVMGPDGNWIEVQIRSERMNAIAERGLAAHWKYKRQPAGSTAKVPPEVEGGLDKWVRDIKEILDNPAPNAMEFLDTIKLNLLSTEIYVFTPGGDLQELPKGATALDFAFALHTDIGLHAEAARVNHQLVPLSTQLDNGVQVEILTSDRETITPEWRQWVTTAKARGRIQSYYNKQRQQVAVRGEALLRDFLAQRDVSLDIQTVNTLLGHYGYKRWEDLYYAFGAGELKVDDQLGKIVRPRKGGVLGGIASLFSRPKTRRRKEPAVRTKADPKAQTTAAAQPSAAPRTTTIELTGIDACGLLGTIARTISDACPVGIINVHLEVEGGLFRGYLTLGTTDRQTVHLICKTLKKLREVQKAAPRDNKK